MFGRFRGKLSQNTPREKVVAPSPSPQVQSVAPDAPVVADPLSQRISRVPAEETSPTPAGVAAKTATPDTTIEQVSTRIYAQSEIEGDRQSVLDAVTFHGPVTLPDVVQALRDYGLAIFPSLYGPEQLEVILQEYNDLMENGEELARGIDARTETPAASYALRLLRKSLPPERFSQLHALFGSEIIHEITKQIFMGQKFDFNDHLYAQWTDHTDVPASGVLHWDRQLTLKSWLYVTDGEDGYGAMRAGVGSNRWLRYVREDAMFDGERYKSIDNSVAEDAAPIVSTGGPAGTFFLFVTDTAHGASPVGPGKRRNIIRAQSRPERIAQWAAWANKI